jgi:hypothetical protein
MKHAVSRPAAAGAVMIWYGSDANSREMIRLLSSRPIVPDWRRNLSGVYKATQLLLTTGIISIHSAGPN